MDKDLVNEIKKLREINDILLKDNERLQVIASEKIENTKKYKSMEKEAVKVHKLENENILLKSKNKSLNEEIKEQSIIIQKLINENEQFREKIACLTNTPYIKHPGGRPIKFDKKTISEIKSYRKDTNASYKEIALKYNCSVGLIHKLINE